MLVDSLRLGENLIVKPSRPARLSGYCPCPVCYPDDSFKDDRLLCEGHDIAVSVALEYYRKWLDKRRELFPKAKLPSAANYKLYDAD